MRFLIIASNLCRDPYPVYPLGMSVVAASAEQDGHEVLQYDLFVRGKTALPETIRAFRPDRIGISIRNLDTVNSRNKEEGMLNPLMELVSMIRASSKAPLLLGGAGFSLLPSEVLALTGAEYGMIGEGEHGIRDFLKDPNPPPGLFRGNRGGQCSPHYVPEFLDFYEKQTHIIPVQTKRGCPFACAYCTYPRLEGTQIRERETESVLNQLEELHAQYSDAMFYFVDAVFNDPEGCFLHLLSGMEKRGLRIPFAAFLSPFCLREEDIARMESCGMIAAELGIDAGCDETLNGLQKNFTFSEASNASAALLKHGIGVTTNVMFGGPGETWDTVRKGIHNLRSMEPAHTLIFSGIRVYPGTPLYEKAWSEGKIPERWNPLEEIYYFADGIDPESLHEMLSAGFAGSKYCIYPPQAKNAELRMLHQFGYAKWRRQK